MQQSHGAQRGRGLPVCEYAEALDLAHKKKYNPNVYKYYLLTARKDQKFALQCQKQTATHLFYAPCRA